MPSIQINGRSVQVSDDFLKLSPEEQDAAVDEIAGQLPPADDKVEYGNVLPMRFEGDDWQWDFNAGIPGAIKRAVTLPGEVMRGEVDPMSDEGIDRAFEMAGVVTPVGAASKAGMTFAGKPVTKRAATPPPSAKELHDTATSGFDAMRRTGAEYASDDVANLARALQVKLENDGIFPVDAPKTFDKLNMLADPPENSVATISNLASARKSLRNPRKDFNNPTDQEAARQVLDGLDGFIETGGSGSSVAGPTAAQSEAAKLLQDSNANYAAAKRSSRLTGIEAAADLRAAAANSGQNTGNAIRQRTASVLLDPKKSAGFSQEELKALEGVVKGSRSTNATRWAGNALGGGGGLGSVVAGGAGSVPGFMLGSPELTVAGAFAAPMVGAGSKGLSNALTRKALRQADDLVRSRSPLHQAQAAQAPVRVQNPEARAALIRALMLQREQFEGGNQGYEPTQPLHPAR